jgi:hypothetical protein
MSMVFNFIHLIIKVYSNRYFNPFLGPIIARPPHSHRFSPPTQWTQV